MQEFEYGDSLLKKTNNRNIKTYHEQLVAWM
jgi:hypothetical protein